MRDDGFSIGPSRLMLNALSAGLSGAAAGREHPIWKRQALGGMQLILSSRWPALSDAWEVHNTYYARGVSGRAFQHEFTFVMTLCGPAFPSFSARQAISHQQSQEMTLTQSCTTYVVPKPPSKGCRVIKVAQCPPSWLARPVESIRLSDRSQAIEYYFMLVRNVPIVK